jgi:ribonuclease P/MRP protein subunit POP5
MPVRGTGRRYLRFWVAGEMDHDMDEVANAIQEGVLSLYGTRGLSRIEPKIIEFKETEQRGILRCDRDHLTEMRAALTLITQIGDSLAAILVEKVSGTLRSLRSP